MFIPTDVWREAAEWKAGEPLSAQQGVTHTSARPPHVFILCPSKVFFFMQLDGAATRGHHEITALDVVIVKIMDGDVNIEMF